MRIIGIDPGSVSGAYAVIDSDSGCAIVDDVPTAGQMVDAVGFAAVLQRHRPDVAIVEIASAYPKQGVTSAFKFGMGTGLLRGVVLGAGIPLHQVAASRWKRAAGLSNDKEQTRATAIRLWPRVDGLNRKKDHNRAEALLLAAWWLESRPGDRDR